MTRPMSEQAVLRLSIAMTFVSGAMPVPQLLDAASRTAGGHALAQRAQERKAKHQRVHERKRKSKLLRRAADVYRKIAD